MLHVALGNGSLQDDPRVRHFHRDVRRIDHVGLHQSLGDIFAQTLIGALVAFGATAEDTSQQAWTLLAAVFPTILLLTAISRSGSHPVRILGIEASDPA